MNRSHLRKEVEQTLPARYRYFPAGQGCPPAVEIQKMVIIVHVVDVTQRVIAMERLRMGVATDYRTNWSDTSPSAR